MKYPIFIVSILLLLFTTGCDRNVKRTISLTGLERLTHDSTRKILEFCMTKVYPANLYCTSTERYANLYIAKWQNDRLVYIFEFCKPVSEYAYDTTCRYVPTIDTSNILKDPTDSITVNVPHEFSIPKGSLYTVVSDLYFDVEK